MNQTLFFFSYYKSPIGVIEVSADNSYIFTVSFVKEDKPSSSNEISQRCVNELDEFFFGKRKNFSVSFSLSGTPFQKKIWGLLPEIPYGSTSSYKELAKKSGCPAAYRAAANALAVNPVAVIIPCHRVIASDGRLSGYAYGVEKKRWLLEMEKRFISEKA